MAISSTNGVVPIIMHRNVKSLQSDTFTTSIAIFLHLKEWKHKQQQICRKQQKVDQSLVNVWSQNCNLYHFHVGTGTIKLAETMINGPSYSIQQGLRHRL